MSRFTEHILSSPTRVVIPILTFPGGRLTGATLREMVHDPAQQVAAQCALRDRFHTHALLSAMDLSTEAEEFGATILFSDEDVPTVTGRLVTDLASAAALPVPRLGTKRTGVYLRTIEHLTKVRDGMPVLGGLIGPFSLAGRLFGVSEALLATAMEPEPVNVLLEKTTAFLTEYARAFREAGADAVIMAEPTAGLMSPVAAEKFSSPFIRRIRESVEREGFQVILHNCGARIGHLQASMHSGAKTLHFGKPMDIAAALARVPPDTVLGGNLDPAEVLVRGTPSSVASSVEHLLAAAAHHRNFFLSSGCDVPSQVPMENLTAFFETAASFHQ
jgi:uroporphyrinogen decarboxylase